MQTNFFTVSLPANIPTLKLSLRQLQKFYNLGRFTIICPDASISLFAEQLSCFRNIQFLPESSLLTFSQFKDIVNKYVSLENLPQASRDRLGWYYQQALKLSFLLTQSVDNLPIVMWDADTIPVAYIEFFSGDQSILYGSALEFHHPYFQTMRGIFAALPPRFAAFTIQFFTVSITELIYLKARLTEYLPRKDDTSVPDWISQIIIHSVFSAHGKFHGSLFSEQELVGLSNMLAGRQRQQSIAYLRWGFDGIASPTQMRFISYLGFKHITYENVEKIIDKKQSWFSLLLFAAKEVCRQKLMPAFVLRMK